MAATGLVWAQLAERLLQLSWDFVGNLRVMDQELFLAFESRNNWLFSKFAKLPYISEHEYFAPREKTSFEDKKD